ncbi:MAG: DUF2270 domain-containing protein [Acidobacteria bacterium]|nr:DUF2270 domain-containing protein [Acidobacteriota bacterium]
MLAEKTILFPNETVATSNSLPIPSTPSEYINALAHYYRGEMARMTSWRDRIDRTTNWAITVAAAMLSVSLSSPSSHHGVLLFAMLLVFLLLVIESRRYRFFDVYRRRVRLLERNYYAAVFAPAQGLDANWMQLIGNDLRVPQFYISLQQGMARRLRRNYCWLFLILLLAWTLKTTSAVLQPGLAELGFVHSPGELLHNAAIVYIPGWLVLAGVLTFYAWLGYVMFKYQKVEGELSYGEVHV